MYFWQKKITLEGVSVVIFKKELQKILVEQTILINVKVAQTIKKIVSKKLSVFLNISFDVVIEK